MRRSLGRRLDGGWQLYGDSRRSQGRKPYGSFPQLTVSFLFVLGLMIVSLHEQLYNWKDGMTETVKPAAADLNDDLFRAMDFGADGFGAVTCWAKEQGEEPGMALAVWMAALDYDLGGIAADRLSRERYETLRDALSCQTGEGEELHPAADEAFGKTRMIYEALVQDLQVFPIPRNSDPACAFPVFGNDWGNPRTYGGERHHEGCDIMGDWYADGTYPVISMTDGIVEKIGWLKLGGWRVGIRSENGIYYYYAHLDSYAAGLAAGDRVQAGQIIGYMGSTGYSTVEGTSGNFAVHLHVGIYIPVEGQEDISVNPYYLMKYLEKEHVMTAEYDWE